MKHRPRHIVIFGGSAAIGQATAAALARDGARLTLIARGEPRLALAAERLRAAGAEVATAALDIFDQTALEQTLQTAVESFGSIDGAVIAVSFPHDQGTVLADLDVETFMQPIDRFLRAHFLIARAVAPRLARGGTVVSLSTPIAKLTEPGHLGYAATCAGIEAFSRNLAHELAASGGRAVCVRPHAIPDAIAAGSYSAGVFAPKAAALGLTVDEWLESAAQGTMTGALPTLTEVGELIAFIVSGRAPSITATVVDLTAGAVVS